MNFKKVMAGVLAAASVLSLAGCGDNTSSSGTSSSGTTSSSTSSDAASNATGDAATGDTSNGGTTALEGGLQFDASKITEGMELKVLTNRTDRDTDGSLAEMVKPFEERYGCKVTFLSYKDYDSDVKTMMTGTDFGDVLNMPTGIRTSDFNKYFEPLGTIDELSSTYNWVDQKASEDTVYAIATGGNASGICYNTKVWADAGITELPQTEEDFIADLKKIKENTGVIPAMLCYTDAASWILKEYTQYAPAITGDPDFKLNALVNKTDIFGSKDNQTPYYLVLKMMWDMYKDPDLHEVDVTSSKWEASKNFLAEGKIGTFIVGSWAYSQFKVAAEEAGIDSSNVGFMPLPFNVDGKQYSQSGPDTSMSINKNISDEKKELAKAFIKWWVEESTWALDEGFLPTLVGGAMPDSLAGFTNVTFFTANPLPDEISKTWDNIDKYSGVGIDKGNADNYKIKICEAALKGEDDSVFEGIIADCNKAWAEARDADEDLNAYLAAQG